MPADHGHDLERQVAEDFGPALKAGVDDHDFLVIAGCGVTEHHLAEPVDGQRHRVRQARQPADVIGTELLGRPWRYGVAHVVDHAAGKLDQLPVRVAAHPDHLVAQAEQPVKHLCRLRSCGDVPGEHDPVGALQVRLGQHRVERGHDPMDVGQDRD